MGKKRISVTKKLLNYVLPLLTVLIAAIIITCFINTKGVMTEEVLKLMEKESSLNVEQIVTWKNGITEMLKAVQGTLETIPFASDAEELQYLEKTVEYSDSIPYGVYEGDADGIYLDGSGWVPDADYIVYERDWYLDGLKSNEFVFGSPYIDANTGSFIVSASTLLNRSDKNKRVAAVDIMLDEIANHVSTIKVMNAQSGYAFLVEATSNTILAHADSSMNGVQITPQDAEPFMAQIATHLTEQDFQIIQTKNNGVLYYVSLDAVEGTNWVLVSCVAEKELFAKLRSLEVMYAIFSVLIILISGSVIGIIIHRTTSPIQLLTDNISSISEGDFTIQVAERGNDEITTMSIALREYVAKMCQVIGDIRQITEKLDDKAQSGMDSAVRLNVAASEQTDSIKGIKSTMEQLAFAVNEIAENATKLAMVVDTASSHVSEANEKMHVSVTVAGEGYKNMSTVQSTMQEIVASSEDLAVVVENVGKSTEEINEIIQMIGEIADSTNLLALNASIEAARAGEAGKGFAVVADEISKLAASSSNSIQKITEIIQKINTQVSLLVDKMQGNVDTIEGNSKLLDVAYDGFHSIYNDIEETSGIMTSIMSEVNQVNDVASNMAAIAQEQSASAQIVTEKIDQIFEQSEQVTEESQQVEETAKVLSEVATSLKNNMDQFKISE